MLEAGPERLFHPHTLRAAFLREVVLGSGVALGLGFVAHRKWRPAVSMWLWPIGVVGLAWRLALGKPPTPYEELNRDLMVFLSLRMIFYSVGAFGSAIIDSRSPARLTPGRPAAP
jgi:hypothetical protein